MRPDRMVAHAMNRSDNIANHLPGEWSAKERDDLPWQLAKEYYDRCEAYDQTVCSGKREGVAMPVDVHELGLVNRNANRVLKEMQQRAQAAGFTNADLRDAMHEYMKQHG